MPERTACFSQNRLEAVATKMSALVAKLLFGKYGKTDGDQGYITAMHNFTGPGNEAGALRVGGHFDRHIRDRKPETFVIEQAGYDAAVVALPIVPVRQGGGLSDAITFMAFDRLYLATPFEGHHSTYMIEWVLENCSSETH